MNQKKKIIIGVSAVLLCFIGILAFNAFTKSKTNEFTYSNLADEKTLNEVATTLEETGVSKENVDIFKKQVNYTNGVLKGYPTFKDGFTTVEGTSVFYNTDDSFNRFGQAMIETDINCRIGAWPIMQDIVNIKNPWTMDEVTAVKMEDGGIFGYERSAIDVNEFAFMDNDDLVDFWALYEDIPLDSFKNVEDAAKHIESTYKEKGITFEDSNRSVINMYVYNKEEKKLMSRHVGVLIEREDDLLFVERMNPTSPYQAAIFNNRKDLENHLTERFEEYGYPVSVIMENGAKLNTN